MLAGSPGTGVVFEPLLAQLRDRETGSVFFKRANGHHLVVIVVVHWSVAGQVADGSDGNRRCHLMFEPKTGELRDHLRGPNGLDAV